MTDSLDRRRFLAAALATAAGGPLLLAQDDRGLQPGERRVDPLKLPLDRQGVWTLHFRYKPPRIVTLKGFDKAGKPADQLVWYMWYQVYNREGEPVYFLPEFELVTKDLNTAHLDEPQPYVFDQIKKLEDATVTAADPAGVQNILSSVEISKRPIPPSKRDAFPRLVTGVAVWTDMTDKAPKTNRFSVYVTGLSNGVALEQTKPVPPDNKPVELIKKKTLRLDFVRPTDDRRPEVNDIRPDDATGPSETWVYRTAAELKPKAAAAPKKPVE